MAMNIEQEVKEIIAKQFKQDIETIELEDVLAKKYAAKSQDMIQMSAIIQKKYEIKIPYIESHSCKTVGDWVKLVDKKVTS